MIRRISVVLGAAAFMAFAPLPAQSQIYLGPEVAWRDGADLGLGAGIEFDLPQLYEGITFMGDFIYFIGGDDFDYFEFNGNLSYDLPLEDVPVVPFGLAGLNIGRQSSDAETAGAKVVKTELGLNLGAGVKFDFGGFRPRVAARYAIGGWEEFTIYAFLPFRLAN
ncbi:MAG: hypothetical protein P8188_00975 [Gemmatimonadota bacterium]|jgi:hypothetical protein